MPAEVRKVTVQAAFGKNHLSTILAGDWTDLSTWAREVTWQFGRSNELDDFDTGTATVTLLNRDRRFDPNNATSPYVGQLLPNVPVRIQSVSTALSLPGTVGARASTPDHSSLDITGDIDIRVDARAVNWAPGGGAAFVQTLIAKFVQAGSQNGYMVQLTDTGFVRLVHSTTGANVITTTSTVPVPAAAGTRLSIRVMLDVNNGAAGFTVTFFTAPTIDGDYVQLGAPVVVAGVTSIFNSSATLEIGSFNNGATERFIGQVYAAEVRNGIFFGPVVAKPYFFSVKSGTTTFTDGAGRPWTLFGAASIAYDTGGATDEFYGFVQSGWEQDLAPKGSDECRIELVDRFGVMAGVKLPDVFEYTVLAYNPVGFWILNGGDNESEGIVDLGSGRHNGLLVGAGITAGHKIISPGHQPAAYFDLAAVEGEELVSGHVDLGRSPILTNPATAMVMLDFLVRGYGTATRVLFTQHDGNSAPTGVAVELLTSGQIRYRRSLSGTTFEPTWPSTVVDEKPHLMFGYNNEISLTANVSTVDASPAFKAEGLTNGIGIGGHYGVDKRSHFHGWIGVVAIWQDHTTVGTAGRNAIRDAYTKLNGQRTDQHIAWALDRIGVPAGSRNLDVGTVTLGPANSRDKDALQFIQEVAATEGGGLYVDHRDGGKIRFTNRYARFLNTRSTTSQATFSDDPAVSADSVIRYPAEGLELSPNGLDGIVNQVTAHWEGGEVVVSDQPSIDAYGPRPREISTANTAVQARSAAEWMIARYKSPLTRVRAVVVGAKTFNRHDSWVQRLRVDDRVTFRVHPLQVGAATTVSLFVDGVSHSARGVEWTTSFRFAPVDTFTPWIWGTSTWGGTKLWG